VQKLLEEFITDHGAVVFNGDGYSDDWQVEAAARGLPNLRTTLEALPELVSESALELFSSYGVFSHREMHSRYEIGLEQYALSVGVEARLTLEIGTTSVLPAAVRHQTEVAVNLGALTAAGLDADVTTLDEITVPLTDLRSALATLRAALAEDGGGAVMEEARHAQDALLPAMAAVRAAADLIEGVVADDLWPLPTYQEMLYIL
jgi:glutamine synthetase